MTKTNQTKWHSLGDFLKHKEEREKEETSQPDTPVATPVETPVATPVETPVVETVSRERAPYLDATHTSSEKSVYSIMYRETITRGVTERHFGFKELSQKTGIRSDKTMRVAIDGLIEKRSIEVVAYQHGNPLGPRFRVYDPRDIARRRKAAGIEIDPQSRKIIRTPVGTGVPTGVSTGGKVDGRTPVTATPVTPVENTGAYINVLNKQNKENLDDDDAALAGLNAALKQAAADVTGRELSPLESERWRELGEVLATELKIAAARTTVSSVPSFLAEHLRRRLWKKDKRELQAETSTSAQPASPLNPEQARRCPDCGGTGFKYKGENFTGGVEKCKHENLVPKDPST